jgi:hypothetical protein
MFPQVVAEVRRTHVEVGLFGGHDVDHAIRVGEMARRIAMEEWKDPQVARLAGLAGLCHNADRIRERQLLGVKPEPESVTSLVKVWLMPLELPNAQVVIITDAVLRHSRGNEDTDTQETIALKDADRVVNMAPDLIIRSGQHYHMLPAVDYVQFLEDPNATYAQPGSVLRDIWYVEDWVTIGGRFCCRTNVGQTLALKRWEKIMAYVNDTKAALVDEGYWPYPMKK